MKLALEKADIERLRKLAKSRAQKSGPRFQRELYFYLRNSLRKWEQQLCKEMLRVRDGQWRRAYQQSQPKLVKGDWISLGHTFNERMTCGCGLTYSQHQNRPKLCPDSLVAELLGDITPLIEEAKRETAREAARLEEEWDLE